VNSFFGVSVASAGDIDGNGSAEIAVGASYHDSPVNNEVGKVYVYSLKP
jgi:hypothetical protein